MSRILMVYASMTGNTQEVAEAIAEGIRSTGKDLEIKEVMDATAKELEDYDAILLGAYTWGDGDLPDECLDFYEEMDDIDLSGKKVAAFGSCDSAYEHVGAAVDILLKKASERGAETPLEGLKIELSPNAKEVEICKQFGVSFSELLG
ncbi:flavodoxin [Brevibacillus agri]|uniref:Flavodoxin n=1 Tax=Brevibacillus agri TaxID=51101 RepID=A0A3M8AVV9_9BACL|nr:MULTISPECIES: flavodoxin [Brevibacillus]ELK40935.1 flavodoxin [Brevibacillus agri BAB-2500]EJL42331.1 flavodoxin, short chain [Brevibacillus sp. CF112]MBG9565109.1 flavodoxin [Brevibacillus agri]MBY0051081.1 flavodoxin [Brevibacillus agri]MCG5250526.1 flavodoxin [Brevibacillus agri]